MPVPPKVMGPVSNPLHTITSDGCVTVGVGLTVIVKVLTGPEQLSAIGVTVMVATTCEVLLLTAVKDAMFPIPLAPRPTEVVLLAQV